MLLLSDPRVAAVPVEDSGEPLVDLRAVPGLSIDHRKADPRGDWVRLREGVADRVREAQTLLPRGMRLLIVEGYRPAALQSRYFDDHRSTVQRDQPTWSARQVAVEASKHVSPVEVAPHPCGAAVDLTLCVDGAELDLGTPLNATPQQSAGACFTGAPNVSAPARERRRVMAEALEAVGLVNYPPEWWHWSYGDRYWAAATGASHALYGPL
ncbi:D-alanyl-D-alanine dipeptidase [Mumia flava]|uniref:D-alanyl-D-alanine dipeptidase n=1 Tax=Mumia flava TaxID=1348852 RepID=A0A0B2BLM7_9ACTN|nr:M15 family metallopeptidase [Mumia flava]PJJ54263.1 D-alanyl-D-alanine dipeptidase [Mumia flava]